MANRKICVVTGTRAEYGLLYWLLKEIQEDPELELQLVVTGAHLSPEFGLTYRQIENDGFDIVEKVEMLLSSDSPIGVTKSLGLATIGFADALNRLKPDILVLLGDRYEILAAAQAAMIARIPIAHISGGETTEGVIDEAIRHSVTKMSHLHFVGAEAYRKRVIQLGEEPRRVFNFGDIGLDNIQRLQLLDKKQLEESIHFELGDTTFLVTYHPESLHSRNTAEDMTSLFKAIDHFPDAKVIITKSNADMGGRLINQMIDEYANSQPDRVFACTSLGQVRYLSAMLHCDVVIGNSSSGIVEAPVLKKPTINIGNRQSGRLKADSIIDCSHNCDDIVNSIRKALSHKFRQRVKNVTSLYGSGKTSVAIKETLKKVDLQNVLVKTFYDLP